MNVSGTDKQTDNKPMALAAWTLRIISGQQHLLTTDDNVISITISIDQPAQALSSRRSVSLDKERDTIEGDGAEVKNEQQAPEGKVGESERCDRNEQCFIEDRFTLPTPEAEKWVQTIGVKRLEGWMEEYS